MTNRHSLAFREGESRFVFAAWRNGSPGLVEMPDGGAELWRPRVQELMCPVIGCPSPEIGVVNRGRRRHGFAHRAGGDHGPESLNHVQGKALLVRWATATYPDAIVAEEHPSNAARERVADVMVTFTDGRRVALEVQYSALDVDKWQERHDSYRRQGILDIWFFGHDGAQASTVGDDGVALNAVQEAAAEHGPVLWLNPITEQVGYPAVRRWSGSGTVEMLQSSGTGQLRTEPLAALRIGRSRVHSETLDLLVACAAAWRREEDERTHLEQVAAARREAEAQRQAERARRTAETMAWFQERQRFLLAAWEATAEYRDALAGMGGAWPRTLSESSAPMAKTPFPALMWQWLIWDRLIQPAAPEQEVTVDNAAEILISELGARGGNTRLMRFLAASFLTRLADRGLLRAHYNRQTRSTPYVRSRRYFIRQPPPWASPLIAPVSDGAHDLGSGRPSRIAELHARVAQRSALAAAAPTTTGSRPSGSAPTVTTTAPSAGCSCARGAAVPVL